MCCTEYVHSTLHKAIPDLATILAEVNISISSDIPFITMQESLPPALQICLAYAEAV